jgi:hypothetical protein
MKVAQTGSQESRGNEGMLIRTENITHTNVKTKTSARAQFHEACEQYRLFRAGEDSRYSTKEEAEGDLCALSRRASDERLTEEREELLAWRAETWIELGEAELAMVEAGGALERAQERHSSLRYSVDYINDQFKRRAPPTS